MKNTFEYCLNELCKNEINSLFGDGSNIKVNYIKYSTNNKTLNIDCKLLTTDPKECEDTYPLGLELLVSDSWKWMGIKENITLTHSIDIK
jgi:hypothetical protein